MNIRNSLKKVLTINNIFFTVVPVLVISLINLYIITTNLSREITARNMLIAVSAAEEIDGFLEQALQALNHVKDMESFATNEQQLQQSLDAVVKDFRYFESIQLVNATGDVKYIAPLKTELLGINLSGKDFFRSTQATGKPHWSATFISLQTGQPTVTLTIPFRNGVIAGYINLSKLSEITTRIKLGQASFGTVIDQNGTYITHNNQQNVDQRVRDQFFKAIHGNMLGGQTYQVNYDGKEMLASVAFVKLTKWPVLLYQSKQEAYAPIQQAIIVSIIGALIAISVTLIISFLNLRKVLQAIENCLQWTKEIASGNYNYSQEINNFQEFQQLAGNFNLMSEKIKSREEALYLNNQELEQTYDELVVSEEKLRNQFNELQKSKVQLEYLGYHDITTGLYNRTFFEQAMKQIELQQQGDIGFVMLDLDGLKLINDTLGHEIGDIMLQDVARILTAAVRKGDILARIGGDEFAILLPNSTSEKLEAISQKILNTELSGSSLAYQQYPISLSLGYAISNGASKTVVELFREADRNMYRAKLHKGQSFHSSTLKTLMKALEERDFITEGHCERIETMVKGVGEVLGLKMSGIYDLRLLARFHDIGKVGISDRILFKAGALDHEEWVEMRRHSEIGYRIAQSSLELMPIADLILKHHEHWDGKGYPLEIQGEEIPLECRILAIADAYDAMTSERPYYAPKLHEEALQELRRCAGTQLDPGLVPIFIEVITKLRAAGQSLLNQEENAELELLTR